MIDLHSRILSALDDGARALEESVEMAESCLAEGVTAIEATPHVRADYPTAPLQMEASLRALRVELDLAQIPLGNGLAHTARAVGDSELAHWLTAEVPQAIVDGMDIPKRPQRARRRHGLFGLG